MSESTTISWTHHTFNPWLGCCKVSEGCRNCYAERFAAGRMGIKVWGATSPRKVTAESTWHNPITWHRKAQRAGMRRRVFCGSLCDVFEDHPTPNATRRRLWELIAVTPGLDWLLLTKRPENISSMLPPCWGSGWPHVWIGTSVENAAVARRLDLLRQVPAAIRFVSYEPALGPLAGVDLTGIHWLIYGGESGPGYRNHEVQWARDMRAACSAAGVAFYFKQSPGRQPGTGTELDGQTVREYP